MTEYKFHAIIKFKVISELFSEHFSEYKKTLFLSFLLSIALLLTVCGGGSVPLSEVAKYTTTVTGTVTALPPGELSSMNLPGAIVSAITTPANSANRPVTSGPDGRFSLQVKHSGTFKLKVENACYNPFTSASVNASADGSHNAGAISLNLNPDEPTGTARYSITPRASGGFKLTVNCVRTIGSGEFASSGTIITTTAPSLDRRSRMITKIALPFTLKSVGEGGLRRHFLISGTLTIPRNVENLARQALRNLGFATTVGPTVVFEPGSKLTTIGKDGFYQSRLNNFTLPANLETIDVRAFFGVRFSFSADFSPSGTLIIPAKVSKIGNLAFARITGINAVDIRSNRLAKPPAGATGATANFPLGNNLFQNVTGITEIKLPVEVYNSYNKAQLQAIFGSAFTNYRRPDGTAYDFAAKSQGQNGAGVVPITANKKGIAPMKSNIYFEHDVEIMDTERLVFSKPLFRLSGYASYIDLYA